MSFSSSSMKSLNCDASSVQGHIVGLCYDPHKMCCLHHIHSLQSHSLSVCLPVDSSHIYSLQRSFSRFLLGSIDFNGREKRQRNCVHRKMTIFGHLFSPSTQYCRLLCHHAIGPQPFACFLIALKRLYLCFCIWPARF